MDGLEIDYDKDDVVSAPELTTVHNCYRSLFYVLNKTLIRAEEIMREAQGLPPNDFIKFIEPLNKLVASILTRGELGTLPKSAQRFNNVRNALNELKVPSSTKDGDTAAGVLFSIVETLLKEIYELADRANELQFSPEEPSAGTKKYNSNELVSTNNSNAVFLGFKPKSGGSLINVIDPELVNIFSVIYANKYLRTKFEDPQQGLLNAELRKYGIKLSKKIGRSNRANNEIFEQNIVIGVKNPGSVANTWHLNHGYTFAFDDAVR